MELVLKVLRASGYDVFAPFEMVIDNAWEMPNHEWGATVFSRDIEHLEECDIIVALNYGLYSDSGTAVEIGFALGTDKEIYSINFEGFTDSLMVNNAAHGLISFEYFKTHDRIELNDFFGNMIYNEQK